MRYSKSSQTPDSNTLFEYQVIALHTSNVLSKALVASRGYECSFMMMILFLCNDIDELSEIVKIYDKTFARFGLKISTDKIETMAFNVDEEIKSRPSFISTGDVALKNVCAFKYLAHMIINTDDNQFNFLNFRISSAYQKWNFKTCIN